MRAYIQFGARVAAKENIALQVASLQLFSDDSHPCCSHDITLVHMVALIPSRNALVAALMAGSPIIMMAQQATPTF